MKYIKTALLVLVCCLLLCGCTVNINIPDSVQTVKGANPTSEYVFPCTPPAPPPPSPANPFIEKQWSEWSNNYPFFANEIESRRILIGYNMVVYVTQEDAVPHLRVFRNYSIKGNLEFYGARESYGEKHLSRYASVDELSLAKTYSPGSFIESKYRGKQSGTDTAYCFRGDGKEYSFFIESEVYIDQYRYR